MVKKQQEHISSTQFQTFCALSVLCGLTALFFTFATPSESKNAALAGFSLSRWLLGLLTALIPACFILLLIRERQGGGTVSGALNDFLCRGDRAYFAFLASLFGAFISLWAFRFSWLFVPKNLRPLLLTAAVIFLFAAMILYIGFRERFKTSATIERNVT